MDTQQTAVFHGETVAIIPHNNQFWLTAESVGKCLGYAAGNARTGIVNLYNRHLDEFTAEDTCVIKLMTQSQGRESRVFSKTGCYKLGFFASTPRAKAFRTWASRALAGGAPSSGAAHHLLPEGEGRLDAHMAQLAAGMNMVLTQNQIVHRYIALLEMNQRSKRRICPDDAVAVRQLRDEGMSFPDIGRLLRISTASASLLYHGKYPISTAAPKVGIADMLDNMVQREATKVQALLGVCAQPSSTPAGHLLPEGEGHQSSVVHHPSSEMED